MLQMGSLTQDPSFAQTVTILRSTGSFQIGGWRESTTVLTSFGALVPSSPKQIAMVPEGDRVSEMISFYTTDKIYTTRRGANDSGTSDVFQWHGNKYRVLSVEDFSDFGVYIAVAGRMVGNN